MCTQHEETKYPARSYSVSDLTYILVREFPERFTPHLSLLIPFQECICSIQYLAKFFLPLAACLCDLIFTMWEYQDPRR